MKGKVLTVHYLRTDSSYEVTVVWQNKVTNRWHAKRADVKCSSPCIAECIAVCSGLCIAAMAWYAGMPKSSAN